MAIRHITGSLARSGLAAALLAAGLTGAVYADEGPQNSQKPPDPPGLQAEHGRGQGQGQEQGAGAQEHNEDSDGSIWHRRAFSGMVSNINANGNPKSFDLTLKLGGEEHTIVVKVGPDTAYRGAGHGDVEDSQNAVNAFFAMLQDLYDDSGTDVRANVRGELSEHNNKLTLLAEQVSLHEIEDEAAA